MSKGQEQTLIVCADLQAARRAEEWRCPNNCGHDRLDHVCPSEGCTRGCHAHDGSDGPCDCTLKIEAALRAEAHDYDVLRVEEEESHG